MGQAGGAQGAMGGGPAASAQGAVAGAGPGGGVLGATGAGAGAADAGRGAAAGTSAEAPSLGSLLEAVSTAISRLPVIDDHAIAAGRAGLADQIHRVVADQATPVEAKLARVLDGIASRADLPRELSADLRTVVTGLVREVDRHLVAAAGAGLTTAALGDLEAVRERAQSLLGRVELNQLTNAAHAAAPTEGQMIFQIPLPGGHGDQTAEIRIRPDRDASSRRIDPNNVSVVFQFQLQGLQTVRIGVRVQDRHLTCSVGSTDAGATELLRQHAPELRQGLSGLGYLVDEVRCSVLTAADLALPDEPAPTAAAPRQVLRLDARA
jgi:hypothetical protein